MATFDKKVKALIFCTDGISTRIILNGIKSDLDIQAVIVESKQSNKQILFNRIKKLGVFNVLGQVLFIAFNKALSYIFKKDNSALYSELGISNEALPQDKVIRVPSINSDKVIELLRQYDPELIVVNGTRIISKKILESVKAPIINTHMGITPRYRGVHGAYWALANNDKENCGVTVHLVDSGIDTGGILYQDIITTNENDNFNTYPIRQAQKAIGLLKMAISDVQEGKLKAVSNGLDSKLWYHPTIIQYLKNWVVNNVK